MWSAVTGLLALVMARPLLAAFALPNTVILVGRALFFGALLGVLYTGVAWIRAETLKKAWRRVFGATLLLGVLLPLFSFFAFPVVIERGVGEIVQFRGNEGLVELLLMHSLELLYILLTSSLWGFVLGAAGLLSAIGALVALLLVVDRKPPTREEILGIHGESRRKKRPPTLRNYLREQRGEPQPTLPPELLEKEGAELTEAVVSEEPKPSEEIADDAVFVAEEPALVADDAAFVDDAVSVASVEAEASILEEAGVEPAHSIVEAVEAAADSAFEPASSEPALSVSETETLPELGEMEEPRQFVAEALLQPVPELPSAYEKPQGIENVRSELAAMFDFPTKAVSVEEEPESLETVEPAGAVVESLSLPQDEVFSDLRSVEIEDATSPVSDEPVEQSSPVDVFALPTPFATGRDESVSDDSATTEAFFLPTPFVSSAPEVEVVDESASEPIVETVGQPIDEVSAEVPELESGSFDTGEDVEPVLSVDSTPVESVEEPVEVGEKSEPVEKQAESGEEVVGSPSSSALDLFSSQSDLPDVDSLFDDDAFGGDFSFDFGTDDKDKK